MATPNYKINYNDNRFAEVENDKKVALTANDKLYNNMVNQSDKFYQQQIDASKEWAVKQTELQQANTDFAIEKIEQQKEQAHKDYLKEQSGAYSDWQKQSNQYGAKAEQMASQGLLGTGYSESSQVSMYNTYQNRVATARDSYNRAVLNYDNAIKDAQLQNNSKLAEIAYQSLEKQLELGLQGFQYKNTLLLEQANKKQEIENNYYNRYQDVLAQMNQENSLAEQIRQYNASLAEQKKQREQSQKQWEKEYKLQQEQLAEDKRQFNATHGGSSSSSGGSSRRSSSSKKKSSSSKKSSGNNKINKSNNNKSINKSGTPYNVMANTYKPKLYNNNGTLKSASQILKDMKTYKARSVKK